MGGVAHDPAPSRSRTLPHGSDERKMTMLGVDANCGIDFAALRAGGYRFFIGYLRTDGGELKDPPWALTRELVLEARAQGIYCGAVFQNAHTQEIWLGRDGLDGYELGRANAEIARDLLIPIAGRGGLPIIAAVDRVTSSDGRGDSWRIGPALDYLRGWRDVIGRDRVWVYGSRYTVAQASAANLCAGYWQSYLLDGLYWKYGGDESQVSVHPAAGLLQFGNADPDPSLERFGVPLAPDPAYSYVGHDRSLGGRTLAELPVWLATL